MITLTHYVILSSIEFIIGLIGIVLNRRNMIAILLCIELMLLAANTNFIAFSSFFNDIHGQIMVFFILTVAAAETAIGLAILVQLYRNKHSIDITRMSRLHH
jgi:NADH-quinone oxidoreductase subunit K